MAKRRKVSNSLALPVLAAVAQRPMHPYEIASVIREQGKDQSIKIKWGTLYTVVQNLEKHGYVEATRTVRQGRRPERTVYGITDSGRDELHDWVRELIETPEKEYRQFEAALDLLTVLPPDEAEQLLDRRLRRIESQLTGRRAMLRQWRTDVPRIFLIEAEFSLAMLQAEADWIRSFLSEIRAGTFPGLRQWREVHETGQLPEQWLTPERGQEAGQQADTEEAPHRDES